MSNFKFNSKGLVDGLEKMSKKQLAPLLKLSVESGKLEKYAKQNAPWTDRTAKARQSIKSDVETTDKGYRISLSIGVDYGIWLEFAHERRFAIIEPAIQSQAPKIIKSFESFMERM